MNRPRLPLAQAAQQMLEDIKALNIIVDLVDLDAIKRAAAGELPPFMRKTSRPADPATAATPGPVADRASAPATRSSELNPPLTRPDQQVNEVVMEQVAGGDEVVANSESESTTSHHMKWSKKCAGQNKRTGRQCRAWSTASGYCVFHDPALTDAVHDMRSRGGRSPRRVLVGEARKLDLQVMDRGGIQALIAQVLRLQLLGILTPRQASHTVKLVGHLVSNARDMTHSEETLDTFEHASRSLVDFTDGIAEHLNGRDLTDRANAISYFGAKRQEYLRANEKFGPRTPPRSPSYPYR